MKIRITPGALLLFLALALEQDLLFLATVAAAAFHECGHLLAAKVLKIPLRMLEIDVMGAKIVPAGLLPSYRAEVLLAAAGPAASLLLTLPVAPLDTPFTKALVASTLSFALFNLLPIKGFDGGRVLSGLLSAGWGEVVAGRVLFLTTYLSLLLLFSLSACMLLRYGQSATLAVLSASLFTQLLLTFEPPRSTRRQKQRI